MVSLYRKYRKGTKYLGGVTKNIFMLGRRVAKLKNAKLEPEL